jgi:hypothetical protein
MKTLIEAVEKWIDDKITDNIAVDRADRMSHSATVDVQDLNAKLNAMEEIHIRDANRIADLERRLQLYLDSPSPEYNDGEESTVTELSMRIDDMDSRLDDVESSLEDKIDTCDADEMVDIAVNDIDLESQIIDAVKSEIDAIDFKVTVER